MASRFWIIVCLGLALGAAPARALQVEAVYAIHLGGFEVMTITYDIDLEDQRYAIASKVTTQGMLDWIAKFTVRAKSTGTTSPLGPVMDHHRATSTWRGKDRWVDLRRAEQGGLVIEQHPRPDADDREGVDPALLTNALDPLSAGIALLARTDELCGADPIAIFDGRRRYDIHLTKIGYEPVSGPHITGQGLVCQARVSRIAGFSRKPFFKREDRSDTSRIWFQALHPDLPNFPVRARADTPLGGAIADLVHWKITDDAGTGHAGMPRTVAENQRSPLSF